MGSPAINKKQNPFQAEEFLAKPERQLDMEVWLADLTYTQQTVAADVMPNAIGGIATFTQKRLRFPQPIRLFKYPEKLIVALEKAHAEGAMPKLIGFSNYVWNLTLSYKIAEVIKQVHPEVTIIFGGPNYPVDVTEQESFLRDRPAIDCFIIKEGELAFAQFVEAFYDSGFDIEKVKDLGLESVHCIDAAGQAHLPENAARIRDLSLIPSPYIEGYLDEFFDGVLLPIIQTNRGCPFSCTFCAEGTFYYNRNFKNSADKVSQEIQYIGRRMFDVSKNGGRNDLFIADSNFGMYEEDLETCRQIAGAKKNYGWPEYINVATGKNQKKRVLEASQILGGSLRLSGSVQNLNPEVLDNIKRKNISAQELMELALEAKQSGANTYSEIILGLPGDSKERHQDTIRTIINAGFNNVYLFQLMMLPGTEMCTPATKQKYGMICKYRILPRCYGHYKLFGSSVLAAEIEEICVTSNSLSFADYLDCRRLHLIVTIFYNDTVFGSILKFMQLLEISNFDWIMYLLNERPAPGLQEVFDSFETQTKNELWERREDLAEFTVKPGIIEKFVNGELGNNLLFVHKSLALIQHVEDLGQLVRGATLKLLKDKNQLTQENIDFVDDALLYHKQQLSYIFKDYDKTLSAEFKYDVQRFIADAEVDELAGYSFQSPRQKFFVMDEKQKGLVKKFIKIYGDTPVGIGRILSKVYTKKLLRHCVEESDSLLRSDMSESKFRLAGLQN